MCDCNCEEDNEWTIQQLEEAHQEKISGLYLTIEKMKNVGNCIHGTNSNICSFLNLNNPRCEGCVEWSLK